MCSKRFTLGYVQSTWWKITDNLTGKCILNKEKEIVDLLNSLSDENEQLKSLLKDAEEEIKTLKKSNQQLMGSLVEKDSEN